MNKKIIKRGIYKPFTVLFLVVMLLFTLTSCGKKADLYKGINKDEDYLTLGDFKVTNGELYDKLKWSSASFISEKANEALIKTYLDKVTQVIENPADDEKELSAEYLNDVQDYFIMAIYDLDDIELLDTFQNLYLEYQNKLKYKDSFYQQYNIEISVDDIDALISQNEDGTPTYTFNDLTTNQKEIFEKYYESLARKLFARDYLEDEIKEYEEDMEEDDDPYFTDSEIKTYWTENYKYNYDLDAILIRFINENEAMSVLKAFGLKSYRSRMYYIFQDDEMTNEEYSKWYDDFDFTDPANVSNYRMVSSNNDFNQALMLSIYIEMYNYVYSYRTPINNIEGLTEADKSSSNRRQLTFQIIEKFDSDSELREMTIEQFYEKYLKNENISYNGDDLDVINSSLKSYLYTTLDLSKVKKAGNYSLAAQSYGDYYFMAFKIADPVLPENETLVFDEEDSSSIDRTATSEAFLDKLIEGLKEDTLTQAYIDNAISTSLEDCNIRIYDSNIEIAYMASNSSYSKNRKSSPADGVVARIKYEDTTIDVTALDIWNELEPSNGISTALQLISKPIIKESQVYADVISDDELVDSFYDSFNILLANFANGQLSSYGYDSSLGKYNFLLLYFNTTDVDEIIYDFYCLNEATTKLLNDYSSEAMASLLKNAANTYSENYFSVSATNLLVYVDMDEDGAPDKVNGIFNNDGFDWNTELARPVDGATTYAELAKQLINDIIRIAENSTSSNADAFSSIVEEYNSSSRFENSYNGAVVGGVYDPTEPEKYWAKYRANGLYIKTEELADVSNSTDQGTVSDVLKLAIVDAYTEMMNLFNEEIPTDYLYTALYDNDGEGLLSENGYNLFTITGATVNDDAEFTEEDDPNKIYTDLVYIYNDNAYKISNLYSEDGKLTDDQVRAYLLEYSTSQQTISMPSKVSTALTTYLSPVYTRFTSDSSQFVVLLAYLNTAVGGTDYDNYTAFKFGTSSNSTASTEKLKKLLEINSRIEDGYVITENLYAGKNVDLTYFGSANAQDYVDKLADMQNVYGDNWWTNLNQYAANAFTKGDK